MVQKSRRRGPAGGEGEGGPAPKAGGPGSPDHSGPPPGRGGEGQVRTGGGNLPRDTIPLSVARFLEEFDGETDHRLLNSCERFTYLPGFILKDNIFWFKISMNYSVFM